MNHHLPNTANGTCKLTFLITGITLMIGLVSQKAIRQIQGAHHDAHEFTELCSGPLDEIVSEENIDRTLMSLRSDVYGREYMHNEGVLQSLLDYLEIRGNADTTRIFDHAYAKELEKRFQQEYNNGQTHSLRDIIEGQLAQLQKKHEKNIHIFIEDGDVRVQGGPEVWWELVFHELLEKMVTYSKPDTTTTLSFEERSIRFVIDNINHDPTRPTAGTIDAGKALLSVGSGEYDAVRMRMIEILDEYTPVGRTHDTIEFEIRVSPVLIDPGKQP